ncbi:hypothetical protein N7471_001869 [Penicillium samsonianum]|uniref:uncharacterized protein n=1 Tax=Penicillium samsonianum TaxID=1882272 RepID=UPI0025495C8C|nr:uncharacterized protein N7471_001869 [Penicillium samsonianum]KAJ6142416.1 hypothetical protein N7471_001869 [Penicillium samsonianum]
MHTTPHAKPRPRRRPEGGRRGRPPKPPSQLASSQCAYTHHPPVPGLSPLASLGEGALRVVPPVRKPRPGSPGKVAPPEPPPPPGPRASRGSPSPTALAPSARAANSPAAPTGALRPPRWGAKHHRWRPRPGTGGPGPACSAWLRGHRRAGVSYREGHPARAPTVRSPAAPAFLAQRNATTVAGPQSLSPGPSGPGRFYTNPPTPLGG